jgi:hypothetical protein
MSRDFFDFLNNYGDVEFFLPAFGKSGMNYQSRCQRDLSALGSVAKEQAVTQTSLQGTMLGLPLK